MVRTDTVIHCDPDILGGTPVFVGTRVPVRNLFDSLAGGETIEEFLDGFPTVTRDQVSAALRTAGELMVAHAGSGSGLARC
jgi:uncharacterized protein (DUF433 family)